MCVCVCVCVCMFMIVMVLAVCERQGLLSDLTAGSLT